MATSTIHNGFKKIAGRSYNSLAVLAAGQRRFDIGQATLTQEGAESTALLFGLGTATTTVKTGTADTKFISFYTESSATSGDNRGIYNRFYLSGTGGGGESLRSYTEIKGVVVGTAHGAHISLGMGESTTGGAVTGLGVAMRATLGLPNVALASGGTYAAIQAEIFSHGSASDAGAVTALSCFRVVNDGSAKDDVDDDAFLFDFPGWTVTTGNMIYDNTGAVPANTAGSIRIRLPSGAAAYLMYYDSQAA